MKKDGEKVNKPIQDNGQVPTMPFDDALRKILGAPPQHKKKIVKKTAKKR